MSDSEQWLAECHSPRSRGSFCSRTLFCTLIMQQRKKKEDMKLADPVKFRELKFPHGKLTLTDATRQEKDVRSVISWAVKFWFK